MSVLSTEARVLLAATRFAGGPDSAELARLLAQPLDWTRLGALAEQEKLLPVLWSGLVQSGAALPADAAMVLKQRATVGEFRLALTESALADALAVLDRERIPVMLLKGAALAVAEYGSFAARPMGDLDILVPAPMADAAWNALLAAGWTLELTGGEEFHRAHHHLPGLVDPRGVRVVLEVHRTLLPSHGPSTVDDARLWRAARPMRCGPHEIRVPSPEHQLLHLSVHFAWSHAMIEGAGRTVRDVTAVVHGDDIVWNDFLDLAATARAERSAYWTLRLSQRLGGAQVPPEVLRALAPKGRSAAVLSILERAFIAAGIMRACPSVRLARVLWTFGMAPRQTGFGDARPWDVSDDFREAFHLPRERPIASRVVDQLSHVSRWLRFARMLARGDSRN